MVPYLLIKSLYDKDVSDRVDTLWKVHENRERAGLGGTFKPSRVNSGDRHMQDSNYQINNGINVRWEQLVDGARNSPMLNNPFSRFNQSIVDYPTLHDDVDDIPMYQVDNFERQKHYAPKAKSVVGTTTAVPLDDNDETLTFFDIQGESLYTNPPAS